MQKKRHTFLNFSLGFLFTLLIPTFSFAQAGTAVIMTLQNVIQTSPNMFEYDIMLTNTGSTALALRGYSCGINHAAGMNGSGTITHTFVSRDPSLATIPSVTPGYTASTNHLRLTTVNAVTGNEVSLPSGTPVRLATMRVTNTVNFPSDFNPSLTLQTLTASGKTQCIATCIVTPPGTSYSINGFGNPAIAGSIQALTAVVNSSCFYLNPTGSLSANINATTPVLCYGQSNGSAQISLSGTGSASPSGSTGTYTIDGGSSNAYSSNPFAVANLSAGTHTINITTSYGCTASTSTIISGPSAPITTSFNASICTGSYTLPWGTIASTAGVYTHTYTTSQGCDSIVNANLIMASPSVNAPTTISVCDSYTWNVNNQTYTISGVYNASFLNAAGCDSNFVLNLTVNASTSSTTTVSACETYTWLVNSITYSNSGTYTYTSTNAAGCLDTKTLALTIKHNSSSSTSVSAINSYTWTATGLTYTTSGVYTYSTINGVGCDSIATLNLTINQVAVLMSLQNAIQTSPNVFEYDIMLTYTGTASLALRGYSCGVNHAAGMNGGGSISHSFVSRDNSLSTIPVVSPGYTASSNHLRFTTLNAVPGNEVNIPSGTPIRLATMRVTNSINYPADFNPAFALQTLIASGKTSCIVSCIITPPGSNYSLNGIGNAALSGTLQVLSGNVITPCFYLNPTSPLNLNLTTTNIACYGSSNGSIQVNLNGTGSASSTGTYSINGGASTSYTSNPFNIQNLSAGSYTIQVNTSTGCSSTSTTTILAPSSPITNSSSQIACNTYVWGGTTYSTSGVYTKSFVSAQGCDSVHTLTLTINQSSSGSSSIAACGSYTWNGTTYNTSGVYTQSFLNAQGCDSIHTLNLTIYPVSGSTTVSACNSYVWNGNTYTNSGSYSNTFTSSQGCDSVHTLNLTIKLSTSSNNSIVVSSSYLWAATGLTYTNIGTYTATLLNAAGCDSSLTLNLLVLQQAAGVTMTIQNAVQTSPNEFQYDVMLTNSGTTAIALRGYSCGINHATGMKGTGNITHTFVSRDPLLAALPAVSPGYTATTNHMRLTTVNASPGNEVNIPIGNSVRLATMKITTSASAFPSDFDPSLNLQLLAASGKTSCIATCVVTPPGSSYVLNAVGNTALPASLQVLNGVVNTPCFYLNPVVPFNVSIPSVTICNGITSSDLIATLSGLGSTSTGTYSIDGSANLNFTSNPFTIPNLSVGTHTIQVRSANGCSSTLFPSITNIACEDTLNLKLFIQGYYTGSSSQAAALYNQGETTDNTITDTILVELHDELNPVNIADSKIAILHTDGTAACAFVGANDSYYIAIKHRNAIQTWSANPIQFTTSSFTYDFTTASNMAYGDNMKEVEPSVWAFFSGDLNYDENIDLVDNPILEDDINNFVFGYYASDLNGDGNVDLVDVPYLEENINNFIFSNHP